MGSDVAQEVLSKLFQQVVGEDIANLGFDYVNGTRVALSHYVIYLSVMVMTSHLTYVLSGMTLTLTHCLQRMILNHSGHSTSLP
jgi:hypothetical protein